MLTRDETPDSIVYCIIHLKKEIDREKAVITLKNRGINPYHYLSSTHIFFCTTPKQTYESIFNVELTRRVSPPAESGNYILKRETRETIPSELSTIVDLIVLDYDTRVIY